MPWLNLIIDSDAEHAETLSEALLELGALSVDLLDADANTPDEQSIFGEPGEPPPGIWLHNRVTALFESSEDINTILHKAIASIGLKDIPKHQIETVADNDWVRLTQSQFEPIQISKRLWIIPSWHTPSNQNAINIILDPGLAFGTGSHPTTRLCLRWMDENIQGGETVLDYGCGSGILTIAAIKLGAASAIGIDVDPQAIAASRDNSKANQTENTRFYLPGDFPDKLGKNQAQPAFDLVVANILTNPLRLLAPLLAHASRQGGKIVLSGILKEQAKEVMDIYQQWFDFNNPIFEEGWSCLSGIRR